MAVTFHTETRDAFMLFGDVVAEYVNGVISLEGDFNSGKSLLALAGDAQRHPERYRGGITPETNIHTQIGIDARERKSVFFSDGLKEFKLPYDLTSEYKAFLKTNVEIALVYLSNVWNWTTDSLDPKDPVVFADFKIPVQVRIKVEVDDAGEFVRDLTLSCVKLELENEIKSAFEAKLKLIQPALPKHELKAVLTTKQNKIA